MRVRIQDHFDSSRHNGYACLHTDGALKRSLQRWVECADPLTAVGWSQNSIVPGWVSGVVVPRCGGLRSHGHGKLWFVRGASKLMMSKPAQRVVCAGAAGALGAVMLTGVVQIPAQAALSSPVDLLTQANITLDGAAANDQSGFSVAGAGDVNGDGTADVIIGAAFAGPNGSDSGSSYVVYGNATPTSPVELGSLDPDSTGFRIDGAAAGDRSGWSVAGAGDVNGDGKDDVIIGASDADPNGDRSGSSYVVYGSASPTDIDLGTLGAAGFRIDGAATDDFSGWSVAGAGDVNGDGKDDVIIGAPNSDPDGSDSGGSYVVYGSASPTNIDLGTLGAAGFRIEGAVVARDFSGRSVAGAGDVNGDGKADVIIGAPYADPNGSGSGSSYVVFGDPPPVPPVPPAGKLPQSQKGTSKTLPVKGKKVVNTKKARTKQGQKITAKISRVSSKTLATRGDISCYKVKKGPKRKLVIKTNGQCANIKIWVTYKAPGNATYEKYRNTIKFKTKR